MNRVERRKSAFSIKLSKQLLALAEADLTTNEADLISEDGIQKVKMKLNSAS